MTLYQIVQHFPMFECYVVGNFLEVCSVQVGVDIHDALVSMRTFSNIPGKNFLEKSG